MDRACLVPLDIRTGAAFQGRNGRWGLLIFPAADTNTGQPAVAHDNHWARVQTGQMWAKCELLHRQPYLGAWSWLFLSTTRTKFWQTLKTQLLTSLIIPLWTPVCVVSLQCFSKIHCIHLGIAEGPKLFEVHLCDHHSLKQKTIAIWKGSNTFFG